MSERALRVEKIDKKTASTVVSAKHYSGRLGILWEGFGLFSGDDLIGVCCYGQPSAPIQKHAFVERDFRIYELTRLVVDRGAPPNSASVLIAHSLAKLSDRPCAVISYADSSHGHCGIVYQATNWLYTGATKAHDSLYLVGGEKLHAMTVMGRFKVTDPGRWAKENNIVRVKPGLKHRYFTFVGSKSQKKRMLRKLKYPAVADYPKTEKTLYDCGLSCAKTLNPRADLDDLIAALEQDAADTRLSMGYAETAQARQWDRDSLRKTEARLAEWREVRRICEELNQNDL